MSNPTELYNTTVRANLPNTITYDSVRNRYVTFNNKYFVTYKEAKWYVDYINKFSSISEFAANGFIPKVVSSFEQNKYYDAGGAATSADGVITYGTPGLALMTDSDGFQKWNPHNLLPAPVSWSNTPNTTVTENQEDPDGGTEASKVTHDDVSSSFYEAVSVVSGVQYTLRTKIKVDNGARWVRIFVASKTVFLDADSGYAEGATPTTDSTTVTSLGGGWYSIEVIATAGTTGNTIFGAQLQVNDGSSNEDDTGDMYLYETHAYRSDQGGMAPVPVGKRVAGSETYVPTTSSAVYLPRENSYLYDASTSSWVNNGLFLESEARENLVTYSDLSNGWGASRATLSYDQGTAPDGTNSATKLTADNTASNSHNTAVINSAPAVDSVLTFSVYLKQDTLRYAQLRIVDDPANVGGGANNFDAHFDLQEGTLTGTANYLGTAVGTHAEIESVGNGWYRCSLGLTKYGGAVRTDAQIYLSNSAVVVNNPGFTGTSTESILIYGAQLEEGSTPSSYIPTNGSTVTRAAQTAVIEPENNPLIEVGPELWNTPTITDPDVWAWDGTTLTGTGDASSDTATGDPVVAGTTHRVTFTVGAAGAGLFQVRLGDTFIATLTGGVNQEYSYNVVSTGETGLRFTDTGGTNAEITNISVKPLSMPDALSIGLKGKMTYADEGGTEVTWFDWRLNSLNYIQANLRTQSAATGEVYHIQAANGISDDVDGRSSQYSPGINVPFNIASRHGSTFINGAVDGTALTADTTPTALPDLTAADFEIGPDFMGHIQELTLFDVDVGDTGLEEITS